MRKLITIIVLLFAFAINAQNFTGKAVYKTSRKSNFKMSSDDNPGMDEKMQEEINKRIQKMNQKTFVLEFDKFSSIYKEEVALEAPKPQVGGSNMMVMSFGGTGAGIGSVYYKNIQENRFSNQTEIMGKRFLVKDNLPNYKWEMSSETKNIGKYTCYKATYKNEVEKKSTTVKEGELVEEIKKETIVVTAWYTPQVPVSNGPGTYQGLPGLILEINDDGLTIVCTEIIITPSKEALIEEPSKGKVVSEKKFSEIHEEKMKEMMEKFKGRNGEGEMIEIRD